MKSDVGAIFFLHQDEDRAGLVGATVVDDKGYDGVAFWASCRTLIKFQFFWSG
jgi:hypothetical protein